jgi:hypothetical protein
MGGGAAQGREQREGGARRVIQMDDGGRNRITRSPVTGNNSYANRFALRVAAP